MMRRLRPLCGALLALALIAAVGVLPAAGATGRRVAVTGTPVPGRTVVLTGSGFRRYSILQVRWDRIGLRRRRRERIRQHALS